MDPLQTTLLGTVDQIQFFADRALKGDLSDDARFFQVEPGTAHIQWLVGHMALTIDRISMSALEVNPALPDSYLPLFGFGTKPSPDRTAYPDWAELTGALYGAITRLREQVASMAPTEFARPLPDTHRFAKMIPSRGAVLPFTAMHTSYHLGQVSTL